MLVSGAPPFLFSRSDIDKAKPVLPLLRICISRIWYDIFTLIALTLHCLSDAKGAIMFPNQR